MALISLTIILVGFSLFAGLIPDATGNYSDQRFLLCIMSWLVTCICFLKILLQPHKAFSFRSLLWFAPVTLVFLSGELYPAVYHVEPLMFALFFLGLSLYAGLVSRTQNLELCVSRVISVAAFLAFVYGFVSLMNYGLAISESNPEIDRTVAWGFTNIRYWSHLASWLIPLIAAAQCAGSDSNLPVVRVLFSVAGATWWWILFSTSARGSFLGLLLGSLVVVFVFRRQALAWLRALGLQFTGGAILWLALTVLLPWYLFGAADLREVDVDSSGRMPMWHEAWVMSLNNFPLGMGPQAWLTVSSFTEAYGHSKSYGHPHNMYLLWAAEYGWISILAFTIAAIGISRLLLVRGLEHRVECRDASLIAAFTASFIAACVHASVSAVFLAPASMLTGFLVLTLFLAQLQAPLSDQSRASLPSFPAVIRLLAGAALIVLMVAVPAWMQETWRYYKDNMEDRLTYKGQGSIYSPRFWSHGDFPRQ